jgi:hypothetical protein
MTGRYSNHKTKSFASSQTRDYTSAENERDLIIWISSGLVEAKAGKMV